MDESQIVYRGYLYKRSRYILQWRKRYAIIKGDQLLTFKDEDITKKPTETIYLKEITSVKSIDDISNKLNSFSIDLNEISFYFYAESFQEKEQWISHISKTMINQNSVIKQVMSETSSSNDD